MTDHHPLGIDIGGSGIKGAPVDTKRGEFAVRPTPDRHPGLRRPRRQLPTWSPRSPTTSSPRPAATRPIGVTIPAVVSRGIVRSAANIDTSWIGTDAGRLFSERLGREVAIVNDADAAGVGELHFGAARDVDGLVLLATLGTGIGSAFLNHGRLIPNSELGHLEIDGHDAESKASSHAEEKEDLSWEKWAVRLQRYFASRRGLVLPRSDRGRRRSLQARRALPSASSSTRAHRPRPARQRRRHHRRRLCRHPRRFVRDDLVGHHRAVARRPRPARRDNLHLEAARRQSDAIN